MIANFHAQAIQEMEGGQLGAIYARNPAKAKALGEKYNCKSYTQLADLLADETIDIVTIATPSGAHLAPTIAAAKAGKHVICEKPLEVTPARVQEMINVCNEQKVVLGSIFNRRFNPAVQAFKKAVEDGRFGQLTMCDAYIKWYRTQEYYDSGAWRGTWALDGGGALMNQAVHSVDLLLWLMGPVKEISAMTATMTHERIEVEDVAVANLKFESGALGVIEATTTAYPGALKRVEVSGSKGTAVLQEEDIHTWQFEDETAEDEEIRKSMAGKTDTGGGASDPAAIGHHGHTMVFEDFLKAINEDGTPMTDGPEGRRSVEVICAIYESARTGQIVKL